MTDVWSIKFLTATEAAAALNMTITEFRAVWRRGQIPYLPGAPQLFDEADVKRYVELKAEGAFEPTLEQRRAAAKM